jgi:hypothetical protein
MAALSRWVIGASRAVRLIRRGVPARSPLRSRSLGARSFDVPKSKKQVLSAVGKTGFITG